MTDPLVAFVKARLDEEAAKAQDRHDRFDCDLSDLQYFGDCRCGYPDRVLRDVRVMRQLLELHERWEAFRGVVVCSECGPTEDEEWRIEHYYGGMAWPCKTLHLLALRWDYHPDYREDWRP